MRTITQNKLLMLSMCLGVLLLETLPNRPKRVS